MLRDQSQYPKILNLYSCSSGNLNQSVQTTFVTNQNVVWLGFMFVSHFLKVLVIFNCFCKHCSNIGFYSMLVYIGCSYIMINMLFSWHWLILTQTLRIYKEATLVSINNSLLLLSPGLSWEVYGSEQIINRILGHALQTKLLNNWRASSFK